MLLEPTPMTEWCDGLFEPWKWLCTRSQKDRPMYIKHRVVDKFQGIYEQEKFKVDQSLRWVHTYKSRSLYLLILAFVDLPYRLWNVGPTLEDNTCEGWDTIGWLYPSIFDHLLILIQPWLRYVVEEYRDRVSFFK